MLKKCNIYITCNICTNTHMTYTYTHTHITNLWHTGHIPRIFSLWPACGWEGDTRTGRSRAQGNRSIVYVHIKRE